MRRGPAGALAALASSVVAGGVVLATQLGGGAATPTPTTVSPGKAHASEVHAWVACKADKGKDACEKPVPPGHAKHAKKDGAAPGPTSKHGQGHGWGRAHAPGQLKAKPHKDKDKDGAEDEDETDEPESD
jgi:hypothetical protein